MDNLPFLPFALPDIGEAEIESVVESLRSGWITSGPKAKLFEEKFAEFIGSDVEALAVNSATSGLHLALEAVGVATGDEVITTPYTFTASAEVVRYLGAHPIFVDIDPVTMNIDPSKIEAAITSKTKAILPVHFGGLACDMDAILAIARKHSLKVVEDAAHSFPTTYKTRNIGTLESDVTVFSFYATKTLPTGEGGMLVTKNKQIAARCKVMRLHGIDRDAFDRYTSRKPAWHYEVVAPGFKYNMTDIAAAIGIPQLEKAMALRDKRNKMAQLYSEAFADLPLTLPSPALHGDLHAWHLFACRLTADAPTCRDGLIEQLSAKGIGTSVHFIPLHIHPYWRDTYNLKPTDFPQALIAFQAAVSMPLYTKMSGSDQYRVIDAVRELLS